jgi:hypothetical protein
MIEALRTLGWLWLIAGVTAFGSLQLAHAGSHSFIPGWLAPALTLPWSALVPMLTLSADGATLLMLAGMIANSAILFVIANVASR